MEISTFEDLSVVEMHRMCLVWLVDLPHLYFTSWTVTSAGG